jgi:hypothetical protein
MPKSFVRTPVNCGSRVSECVRKQPGDGGRQESDSRKWRHTGSGLSGIFTRRYSMSLGNRHQQRRDATAADWDRTVPCGRLLHAVHVLWQSLQRALHRDNYAYRS